MSERDHYTPRLEFDIACALEAHAMSFRTETRISRDMQLA